jgi:hypothetical protein
MVEDALPERHAACPAWAGKPEIGALFDLQDARYANDAPPHVEAIPYCGIDIKYQFVKIVNVGGRINIRIHVVNQPDQRRAVRVLRDYRLFNILHD